MSGVIELSKRRIIRAPVNPLDKSTIVSIFPKEINEVKHTIQPGRFTIHAGTYDNPSILIVGPSSWWREIDEDQPLLEIPSSSVQIANSVVIDYCNGLLGYSPNDCSPGLFYIPGELNVDQIKKSYRKELDSALVRQKNWYNSLIKLADSLWARSNGNPLTISDDMRLAAREMGQNSKDWMKDFLGQEMVKCVMCGSLRNPTFPICPTCRYIDETHPLAKNAKFAQL